MIKEYTKQVMQNAKPHHSLTDAQPVPEQQLLPPNQLFLVLLFSKLSYGMEYPFGQCGSTVMAVSPARFLCPTSLLTDRAVLEAEKSLI